MLAKTSKPESSAPAQPVSADYNSRIIRCVMQFVHDSYGMPALETVAKVAGTSTDISKNRTEWLSHQSIELALSTARSFMPDDATFERACAYKLVESYGVLLYVVRVLTPRILCRQVLKVAPFMVRAGRFEIISESADSFHVKYFSSHPESELLCTTRRVQWQLGPTIWGLPPAKLEESQSIARGDECCEYKLAWDLPVRVGLPPVLGVFAFVVGCAVRAIVPFRVTIGEVVGCALTVAAVAIAHEYKRALDSTSKTTDRMSSAILDAGQAEAEARAELVAMNSRQRDWAITLEKQLTERAESFEKVFAELQQEQHENKVTIRGFSHDLKNPIFAIRGNIEFLRDYYHDAVTIPILGEIGQSIKQMEDLLSRLNEVVTGHLTAPQQRITKILVPVLTETLRRRLRALVYGRDIKVSVFFSREAPDDILCDNILLDRVLDNVLTNAAKYTSSGSILIELTGRPGVLSLQVSDTGRGIADNKLESIFQPRNSGIQNFQSQGVGLAGSVELLRRLGGQIEVMSKDHGGSTFWLHLPITPPEPGAPPRQLVPTQDGDDSQIVIIRRSEAG
jgi:signal transduction histidine kinase